MREAGEIKKKVMPYATVYPPGEDVEEIVERFTLAKDRNFRAMKLEEWPGGFGHVSIHRDAEIVGAVPRDDRRGQRNSHRCPELLVRGRTSYRLDPRY